MTTPFPFVAGQVLTAAQLNSISELPTRTLTATGNAVAADRYSRVILNGSSISYTVNSATFGVGEVVNLYNINSTAATIAAGTGGVTINGASGLTLAQYQSAQLYAVSATSFLLFKSDVTATSSPFVYITQGTFSAVASVSMPAGTFTTTYKHYKVLLNVTSSSAGQALAVRVNVSGTAQTASQYYAGWAAINNSGTVTGIGANANSSAVPTYIHSTLFAELDLTVYNPANSATFTSWSGTSRGAAADGNSAGTAGGSTYNVAAAHDGLTFVVGGTFGGTYYVYGIKDS